MTWAQLIPLLVQFGVDATYKIWQIIQQHPEPTEEAWSKLLTLALKPLSQYEAEARARAGLPPLPPAAPPA